MRDSICPVAKDWSILTIMGRRSSIANAMPRYRSTAEATIQGTAKCRSVFLSPGATKRQSSNITYGSATTPPVQSATSIRAEKASVGESASAFCPRSR